MSLFAVDNKKDKRSWHNVHGMSCCSPDCKWLNRTSSHTTRRYRMGLCNRLKYRCGDYNLLTVKEVNNRCYILRCLQCLNDPYLSTKPVIFRQNGVLKLNENQS